MARKPLIGITLGDYNGIGPEVTLKAVASKSIRKICTPLLIGPIDIYNICRKLLKISVKFTEIEKYSNWYVNDVLVYNIRQLPKPVIQIGKLTEEAGIYAAESIKIGVALCRKGKIDAMVTSPISKQSLHLAGYKFPGQTEMLMKLTSCKHSLMFFIAKAMRIGLATVHIPIDEISNYISKDRVKRAIEILCRSLKIDFKKQSPKIGVLALNPHAGEGGILGKEEEEILKPVIENAIKRGIRVEGPFSADGFFGMHRYRDYDAVLAMYHDQALIPLKMACFDSAVNYTAGLPIIRTSPNHGTAFEIAGKGIANFNSMKEAIKLAAVIVNNRKKKN